MSSEIAEKKKPEVVWIGDPPETCDICQTPIDFLEQFIDGRTFSGPWANMCSNCHTNHGVGLGVGKGQKFVRQDDGRWLKVRG